MIKGHAGSGPRVGDSELPILQLDGPDSSTTTPSPQMRGNLTMGSAGGPMAHVNGGEMGLAQGGPDGHRTKESNVRGAPSGMPYNSQGKSFTGSI